MDGSLDAKKMIQEDLDLFLATILNSKEKWDKITDWFKKINFITHCLNYNTLSHIIDSYCLRILSTTRFA